MKNKYYLVYDKGKRLRSDCKDIPETSDTPAHTSYLTACMNILFGPDRWKVHKGYPRLQYWIITVRHSIAPRLWFMPKYIEIEEHDEKSVRNIVLHLDKGVTKYVKAERQKSNRRY